VPDYLPKAECTSIVDILNDYYARADAIVHHRGASDERIFGAEHVAPEILAFKASALCFEVARAFMASEQCCLFTMANRLQKRHEKPARSGGRWHRDRTKRQFKAMLYLVDVTPEMGPFSIFPRSGVNNLAEYAREIQQSSFAFTKVRWNDTEIEPFLDLALPRLETMVAPAGTLVLFDSSLIHSGQPNTAGVRYALTNYYYLRRELRSLRAEEKWAPLAGPLEPVA